MKTETAIALVMRGLDSAERRHPSWPQDRVKACAIIAEETGGLVRACNDFDDHGGGEYWRMRAEAVDTAAAAIRFLKNLED